MSKYRIAGCAIVSAAVIVPAAHGQGYYDRDRYQNVRDRYQADFDPEPVRLGGFVANPALELGVQSDDNVFADADDTESDVIFRIAPRGRLQSNWSRHLVYANVNVERLEYQDLDSESVTNLSGDFGGRLDIGSDWNVSGSLNAADLNEPRFSVANLDVFEEPLSYTTVGGYLEAEYERERVQLVGRYDTTDFDYDDADLVGGGSASQDFRSHQLQRLTGRASFAVSPDVAVFAQASADMRDYDAPSVVAGVPESRDSEGYSLQAGTSFELPVLLRGDVAVGYLENTPDSDAFNETSGLAVDASVEWFPSRLTTVTFSGTRRVTDSELIDVGTALETVAGVRVDHELRRNVLLFGRAAYEEREYDEVSREDENTVFEVGATYKLNKRVHTSGFFRFRDRTSTEDFETFDRNVFGVSVTLYP